MEIVDLIQGSNEWKLFRKRHLGASEASTIMGINPYSSPLKLWKEKLGLIPEKPVNIYMQRGHDLEAEARRRFCEQMGMEYIPLVALSDEHHWMMASFDGIAENGTLLEIKANGPKSHAIVERGIVPIHHMAQLQHQLYVANAELAYYYSFDGIDGLTLEVKKDNEYIRVMIEKELQFWQCLESLIPPG